MSEKFNVVKNRMCDFVELLNLSLLNTFENMKNELNRRNVINDCEKTTRSMIENIEFDFSILNDLFRNLFDTKSLLFDELFSKTNKKLI